MPPDTPSPSFTDRWLQPLEAAGFAAVAGLTRALPVDQASSLSGAAWRRFAPLNHRHQRAAMQLASSLPEKTEEERAIILNGMWDNLGRTTAEAFHIDEILADPDRIETDAVFSASVAKARERGAVFVSLHLGNWELCVPLMAREGFDVISVYQRIKNPHVDAAVIQMRERYYRRGLYPKSAEAAREVLRVAAAGGTIALLGDLRDFRGAAVPFFGREAPSSTFPALVARQRDLPLFAAKVQRLDQARFRATIEELEPIRTTDRADDIRMTTALIQKRFEDWIRAAPEQWMWGHRRWG